MAIINLTKNTEISLRERVAISFQDKLFGLLDKRNPKTMIFYTRFGIHTLFMDRAIDIIVLDNQNRVVAKKESLQPNKFYFYNPRHKVVIEMPKGTIDKTKTSLNDKISISRD